MAKTLACLPKIRGKFFERSTRGGTWWGVIPLAGEHVLIIFSGHLVDGAVRYHPVSSCFIGAFYRRVRGLLRKLRKEHAGIRLPRSGAECCELCSCLVEAEEAALKLAAE